MRKDISQGQIELLERSKAFLRSRKNVTDPENYLSIWAPGSPGGLRVRCLRQSQGISKNLILSYIRNIIGLGRQSDVLLELANKELKFKRVAISWCVEADFLSDGAVRSRYFNCKTDDYPDVLWVMLPLDGHIPEHKQQNIVFVHRSPSRPFVLSRFIKNFSYCLSHNVSLSAEGLFAQRFADEFLAKMNTDALEKLLMPYEGQPWQHTMAFHVKKQYPHIQVIGDLHSCLPPLPTDFIKRAGAPDVFYLHGKGQKDIAVQSLGWADNDIKVVPSLRFGKANSTDLGNKILLPYSFRDSFLLLDRVRVFFEAFGNTLPPLAIRNHPAQSDSAIHLALIKGIEGLQKKFVGNTQSSATTTVVVIGSSSAIIECLEGGMTVFQITEDPLFESYSAGIWRGIDVEYISENIIKYSYIGNPDYLEFGVSDLQMMFDHA